MSFLTDAVETVRSHWPELSVLLDASQRAELLEILDDTEADPVAAANELRELVKPLLPPHHPVRRALTPSGVRFQTGAPPQEEAELPALLRRLRAEVHASGAAAYPLDPAAADTDGPARSAEPDAPYRPDADDAWLLAEPALPAAALSPAAARSLDLIRLTGTDEVELVPSFQLDPESGTPYPVVVEINQLLSAGADPWGAADWWLGSNVWLDAAPARLLGTGADQALLSAARAEIPEW